MSQTEVFIERDGRFDARVAGPYHAIEFVFEQRLGRMFGRRANGRGKLPDMRQGFGHQDGLNVVRHQNAKLSHGGAGVENRIVVENRLSLKQKIPDGFNQRFGYRSAAGGGRKRKYRLRIRE
jgi:hypothetical protein